MTAAGRLSGLLQRTLVLGAILAALGLGGPVAASAAALTLALADLPHYAPLIVAEHEGYFAAEGLDLKILRCVNGKRCLQHLTDGEAQFAAVADVPIVLAAHAGLRFEIVATLATSPNESRVVARADLGIRTAADLRGRRIGFVRGTTGHFYTEAFLLFHGIEPASVTRVELDPALAPAQLARGEVDAAGLYQPQISTAMQTLGARGLLLQAPRLYTATVNLVSQTAAQGVSDVEVSKMLRALQRAYRFMRDEPMQTKRLLAARLQLPLPTLSAATDGIDYRLSLDQSLIATLEAESRWAVREGLVKERSMPDYLARVRSGPLQAAERRAVTIVH